MRDVNAVLSGCLTSTPCRSVETSDSPQSIWNPSIRWKELAAPLSAKSLCITVRCSRPILGPRTRPSEERLEFPSALARMLDPPQSGSSSSAAIQLLPPSGVTAAIAERYRPPHRGST